MNMLPTLHLSLKKEWYNLIESGEKTEEYREIKPYWLKRLYNIVDVDFRNYEAIDNESAEWYCANVTALKKDVYFGGFQKKNYKHVKFTYGYTKKSMTFELEDIKIGRGNKKWGAMDDSVFIIKLGKRIK